jgi:fimbrial chaperone protein
MLARMPQWLQLSFLLLIVWLSPSPCLSGSLQVSATTLDVATPGAATSLMLRNPGSEAINVQIRVFRWSQKDGAEQLLATTDVVASPPFAAIPPGREYTVRIVRTAQAPVVGEEGYRLMIDELPRVGGGSELGVKFAVRHSIPVFFGAAGRASSALAWRGEAGHGQLRLIASNAGNRRVRLAALKVTGPEDVGVRQDGLVGYVLSRSSMSWTFRVPGDRNLRGSAWITADSDSGPIHARIPLTPLP